MKNITLFLFLLISWTAAHGHYTVIEDSLTSSRIYPSTIHRYKVYVPDSYKGNEPAALYLGLDGILCEAPAVIDTLSAEGLMPVTVQIYLEPGVVKNGRGDIVRYNRSNEFDAIDSRFADFLEQELLPAVERIAINDGRRIMLSENPAQRCVFGLSSGGIAAFTAAWHRPDLFGKVFSGCGTFVPMRGGNELQAIVRKHEPKPLRIFLQDGYHDTWNPLFGSWYEANRQLASALEFAGYDCAFDWAEGGHSVRRATEIFRRVMTWLWRTDTVATTTSNNLLSEMLDGATDWQEIEGTLPDSIFCGPRAVYPDGSLCVRAAEGTNYLLQSLIDDEGNEYATQRFYWLHSYSNSQAEVTSMAFDTNGNLWVVTDSGIQICDQNGRVRGILRLPRGAYSAQLALKPGRIYLRCPDGHVYSRRLKVNPAVSGQRPQSQGQG